MDIKGEFNKTLLGAVSSLLTIAEEHGIELNADVQISDSEIILLARYGDQEDISWFRLNSDGTAVADKKTVEYLKGITR